MSAPEKKIRVAGDLVCEHHLVRLPSRLSSAEEMWKESGIHRTGGGAWHLAHLVELAVADPAAGCGAAAQPPRCRVDGPQGTPPEDIAFEDGKLSHAYSVWKPYPMILGEDPQGKDPQVWRIEESLGRWPIRDKDASAEPMYRAGDLSSDLLVLDDRNLGFRGWEKVWSPMLAGSGQAPIVLETTRPLGEGALWEELVNNHQGRLTVVTDIAALRARNADISRGLSWDRTIEDVWRELKNGLSAHDLARANRVVIHVAGSGAAVFERGDFIRFIYHPNDVEGSWHARRPGETPGALSVLTAAVARHMVHPETSPLFIAVSRALAAIRHSHAQGAGKVIGDSVRTSSNHFTRIG